MSIRLKEFDVARMIAYSSASICLGYCAAQRLFSPLEKVGYTCGVYGWNYDVFRVHGVIACTGYRRMKGTYSAELSALTEKYERLASLNDKRYSWYDREKNKRLSTYLLARWAREVKAAIARKEGGKR